MGDERGALRCGGTAALNGALMTMATAVIVISASVIGGGLAYFLARNFASGNFLLDTPNERSSHRKVTPRAGGFAIFGGFAAACLIYAVHQLIGGERLDIAPLAGLGLAAFAFGAADDFYHLRARTKLLIQILLAAMFVAIYGPLEYLPNPFSAAIALGPFGYALAAFWIVAFMNAYNFMDGVNGIAGACGLFVLCALVAIAAPADDAVSILAVFTAAGLFGFLPLNFHSGRIFMGDSGSQFVGFMLSALSLLAAQSNPPVTILFAPMAISPFLVDVAFTLAHRFRRRRNVLAAHNEHIYQLLVRMGRPHDFVATLYLALTALSTAAAFLVAPASALSQYATAALLVGVQLALASAVYVKARKAGLFDEAAAEAGNSPAAEELAAAE